jgi:hypothetical protein
MAETIWVKSAHVERADDPNHCAFHEVSAVHPQGTAHVRGGAVVQVGETEAVKAALKDGLIKKATPTQAEEAAKEARAEARENAPA